MASVVSPSRLMSADEFLDWVNLPANQDHCYELEQGEIVEMPPPSELHGVLCFLLARLLGNYVFERGLGYVCTNDTGLLVEQDPDTVRGPDVMLFDETRTLTGLSRRFSTSIPKLVVEVLSPADAWTRTQQRISQYLQGGIGLVWLVDPEVRSVTVCRPGQQPEVVGQLGSLNGGEILPGLQIPVADLFTLPGQAPR